MLKQTTAISLLSAIFMAFAVSCVREQTGFVSGEEVVISATASLPGFRTKMVYEDGYPETPGVKAGWKTGDTFLALEINGSTVTPVKFTATASADVKTTFSSSGAVAANSGTRWVAVLGKKASFGEDNIKCTYSGQDGSLKGLEGFDYMVASASGETPDFDYSTGRHLTYLLRILAPEGVGKMEFNTSSDTEEWVVGNDGAISSCIPDYKPKAVKTLTLSQETKEGDIIYLAVPAANYSDAGLIVTAMNNAGTKSQGKVKSDNLSDKGGRVATFTLDALIDRPLPSNAIDFVSSVKSTLEYENNDSWQGVGDIYQFKNSPKWAPFNIGASASPSNAEEMYGNYFAWGETEQRDNYTAENYRHAGNSEGICYAREYRGDADVPLNMKVIAGTKYDVARVKWGKDWRMPLLEEMIIFSGSNKSLTITQTSSGFYTDSGFTTKDVTEYNGVAVNGRTFTMNGRTLFLPYAGRYYYTSTAAATTVSMLSKAGYYYGAVHNLTAGSSDAYRIQVRSSQLDYISQSAAYAFSVRPVLARETDEKPLPVKVVGQVKNSVTGSGVAGVAVSDGYNVVKTDSEGRYEIDADIRARTINLTIPSSYEIPVGVDGRPSFFQYVDLHSGGEKTVDFQLTPRSTPSDRFTVIAVSDAHVQNATNLSQFMEGPIPDIRKTVQSLEASGDSGPVIGIALGDQLWDNLAMAADVRNGYTSIPASSGKMPFFYVIGNHDHETGTKGSDYESTANFVRNFGPTDYSFDIGNAHVVVMDNIEYTEEDGAGSSGYSIIKYKTRITGEQLHWLKQDISNVSGKRNKIAILCVHAPIYQAIGNGEAIKSLLYGFEEVHIFSGHIHNYRNHYFNGNKAAGGITLIEHNIQSLCGMWWLADLSPNGTPAGYGVYTFDTGGLVREYNKVTKEEQAFQMRVYSGNDTYNGHTAGSGASSPKKNDSFSWGSSFNGKFLIRIWDGDAPDAKEAEWTWDVTFKQNGNTILATKLTDEIVDKCAAAYIVDILGSPYGTGGTAKSYSWWTVDAPTGNPAAETNWTIVARHYLPGGWEKTYEATSLSRDFTGYSCGSRFSNY